MLLRRTALVALCLALLAAGCDSNNAQEKQKTASPPAPVTTTQVVRKTVPLTVRAIGNVEPIDTVAIKSRIDGQITGVHVRDGQEVSKGQLLFELDARYLLAQVKQLQATAARDRALLANARSQERRYGELLEKKFLSDEAYAQTRTNLQAAEANLAAGLAAIDTARVELSYTRIVSPIAGRAGRVLLPLGNLVKANDTVSLVVINQLAPIYVSFAVPQEYLPRIREFNRAAPLPVSAAPEGADVPPVPGILSFIDNSVDLQTGTIRLRAEFPNRDLALWPGQLVTATLTLEQQAEALVVPPQAVQNGPRGQYVFVVKSDQTAEMREISVQRTEAGDAVIAQGVKEGETVIVSGQLRVVPGGKVQSKPVS